jgi:VIT1/CCC1 family predicted Fe2+/Mn2+ transporter
LGLSTTLAHGRCSGTYSAGSFAAGAVLPLLTVLLVPGQSIIAAVAVSSLGFLAVLGCFAARGGARKSVSMLG